MKRIQKKTLKPSEDQSEINFLIVNFKDRKIEKKVDDEGTKAS